ncbi:DUF6044 family protein [Fictibacillus iocasae]|uniref:DUF6044 family protein n=1 Tax=Fictibacillus iocasae TaxID=2715437 RepID=A0ABW2NVH9_9BACL
MRKWIHHENVALYAACFLLVLYLSPLFLLGENAHVRIHDNLDSNVAWYKVLKESGQILGPIDAVIPQVINGLPRNTFGNEFNLLVWLHYFLPSMTAYAISQAIVRLVAFAGMYLLLKHHVLKEKKGSLITIGTSLCFALTPFWPSGMLSTLGQPIVLWAFLNIREGRSTLKEWSVILLVPFYSSFVLGMFFFLCGAGCLWLYDLLRFKRTNLKLLTAILLMTCLFALIEYRLLLSLVLTEAPSSRNEFLASKLSFPRTIRLFLKNFLVGHNHVMTLHTLVILPVWGYAAFFLWKRGRAGGTGYNRFRSLFIWLMTLNALLSAWYAFWFFKGWQPLKNEIALLNTFNFARFHFLRPLVIYVLFAVALSILLKRKGIWSGFVYQCLFLQLLVLFAFNDEIVYRIWKQPSFKEFYSVELFNEIEEYIEKPKADYRMASVGLHPAIAQYNGFYTLDTYNNFYPLEYKHSFRRVIKGELEKSPLLRKYFDQWGGRCYVFSKELGKNYLLTKDSGVSIQDLSFDANAFAELGGEYLVSAVEIQSAQKNHLVLEKIFHSPSSPWKIYLYRTEVSHAGGAS